MSDDQTLAVYMREESLFHAVSDFFKIDRSKDHHQINWGPFEIYLGKTRNPEGNYCWPGRWDYFVSCNCPGIWDWARLQMFIGIFHAIWVQSPGVFVSEEDNGFMPFFSTRRRFVINNLVLRYFVDAHKYFWTDGTKGIPFDDAALNNSFSGTMTLMDGQGFPPNILDE